MNSVQKRKHGMDKKHTMDKMNSKDRKNMRDMETGMLQWTKYTEKS